MPPTSSHRRQLAPPARGLSFLGFVLIVLVLAGLYGLVYKRGQAPAPQAESTAPVVSTPPKVLMYSTSDCEPCDRARTWFQQRRIAIEERNVEFSKDWEAQLQRYGSRIVPVIVVDGEPLYGFKFAQVEDALKAAAQRRAQGT